MQEAVLTEDNLWVNGLWVGSRLSRMELLTLHSFTAHGHRFRLWLYSPLENPATEIPAGVEFADANDVILEAQVFRYRHSNQFGHGKGSLAGFSDVFRYRMLSLYGGWWVDMDVTCLKPLQIAAPYAFRAHHSLPLVGNVMKCPSNSPLMEKCFERASKLVTEDNCDWHLPILILADAVAEEKLDEFVRDDLANLDRQELIYPMLRGNRPANSSWYCIHWMNEVWRQKGLPKDGYKLHSMYAELLSKHGLATASSRELWLSWWHFHPLRLRVWWTRFPFLNKL
jgi:hypothetical protein